jgi:hypothetical protein
MAESSGGHGEITTQIATGTTTICDAMTGMLLQCMRQRVVGLLVNKRYDDGKTEVSTSAYCIHTSTTHYILIQLVFVAIVSQHALYEASLGHSQGYVYQNKKKVLIVVVTVTCRQRRQGRPKCQTAVYIFGSCSPRWLANRNRRFRLEDSYLEHETNPQCCLRTVK